MVQHIETIDPVKADPKWTPNFSTWIAESKEEANASLSRETFNHYCIYADGSGISGSIGAAATTAEEGRRNTVRRVKLGEADLHTVFEAEVTGIILATDIAYHAPRIRRLAILLDNQTAINATTSKTAQSGQHLIQEAQHQLERLATKHPGIQIKICWVPGHSKNDGNEQANEQARKAAEGDETGVGGVMLGRKMKDIPGSMAAMKAERKREVRREWEEKWGQSKQKRKMSKFDETPPGNKVLKHYRGRTRIECSTITQLRSGHVALNRYLHCIKTADSPDCPRCLTPETVEHYLTRCKRFTTRRNRMRQEIEGPFCLHSILGNPNNTEALLTYVKNTGRLTQNTAR